MFTSFERVTRVDKLFNIPSGIYLLKVNNRNTKTRCDMCSKLTVKKPEQRQWRHSVIFIVNFDHFITPCCSTSIVNFGHAIAYTTSGVPTGIYLLKFNNRKTRTRSEIYSKLTIKTLERGHWCRSVVFIVNFQDISHLSLVFLLLTLNM